MDEAQLKDILQSYGVDVFSFAIVLRRNDEVIFGLTVPEEQAVEWWTRLRALAEQIGFWPVLGWDSRWVDESPEYRTYLQSGSTAKILAESERVDPVARMRALEEEELESLREDAREYGEDEMSDIYQDVQGEWPEDAEPITTFSIPESTASRGLEPRVPVALVPTSSSWHVPALLRFEAGLAAPAMHAAMAKHWHELYGAEIVGMLPDLVEMRVARPPTARDAALALAKEQYLYCQDVVVQGTQTIQALAAGLLNGTAWFFWWD
jgi:hypothetical protein